ncbi:MAG: hypothetical protein NDJ89_14300 [Oligoflexia bacterium]|nr:hypothetical protein [Oligoflexia bacterium]
MTKDDSQDLGEIKIPEENGGPANPETSKILNDLPGVFDASEIPGLSSPPAAPAPPESSEPAEPLVEFSESSRSPAELEGLEEPSLGEPASNAPAELASRASAPEQPFPSSPSAEDAPANEALEKIRRFSEEEALPRPAVPAAFPFSLLIEGKLGVYEKEKLLDLLARENMGIRDIDLEPQFEAGRILIPRISEFAGILLVQALRGTSARLRLAPSDEIFATDETRDASETAHPALATYSSSERLHPAERIPITPSPELPGHAELELLDAITASASLRSETVEAERSDEYQELLESLQRELRYKAHRKGATAIVNFSVHLSNLSLPSQYRLTLMGNAVRAVGEKDDLRNSGAAFPTEPEAQA